MNTRIAAGVALVVVLGIWCGGRNAFVSGQRREPPRGPGGRRPCQRPQSRAISRAGPGGAPQEGALPARKIPDRLPPVLARGCLRQVRPRLASFGDKSLIINFWATWCAPCRSEIPLLETLHAEWADRGRECGGHRRGPSRLRCWNSPSDFKITYPLLIGEQDALDVAAAFGVGSPVFPFTVFTDRRGEVVALLYRRIAQSPGGTHPGAGAKSESGPHRAGGGPARHHRRVERSACGCKHVGRSSPPKLAISTPFLVIIADLCNATRRADREMAGILLLNGPNLNLLGTREPQIYGSASLQSIESKLSGLARAKGHTLVAFQSNAEHELIAQDSGCETRGHCVRHHQPGRLLAHQCRAARCLAERRAALHRGSLEQRLRTGSVSTPFLFVRHRDRLHFRTGTHRLRARARAPHAPA